MKAVSESPFAKWFDKSVLGGRFADPKELEKITQLEKFLADQIGVTPQELLDDVLGDAVVFAYQPGPPGKPEDEAGVVLVNARKPEVLVRLVGKLDDLQQKSGEVKAVNRKDHRGRTYFERAKADGKSEYYLVRGGLLAFSGQERAIREVIEQDLTAPPASEKPGRVAAGLKALGLTDKLAACWFDPRGFDAEFKAKAGEAKDDGERAFLAQFGKVWAATDGVGVYLHPDRGLELGVVTSVDPAKLPKEVRDTVFAQRGGSPLWPAVPDDAIFAAAGRLELPRLLAGVGSFLPSEGQAKLKEALEKGLGPVVGRDNLPAVLAGLGPDWAVWVSPPEKASGTWVPNWTAALKLTGDNVPRIVLQAVDFGVQMARFGYNRDHPDQIELTEEKQDGVTVKVLSNPKGFPPGLRPSYALKNGYLVVASSPEQVRRFAPPAAPAAAGHPLLRFSAKQLRAYLDGHRSAIAEAAAKWSGKPAKQVEDELGNLSAVLEAFDRVEVRQSVTGGTFRVSLHVEFAKPLK